MVRCRISYSRRTSFNLQRTWTAYLDLLDATADALAATWDQRGEVSREETFNVSDIIKPTIH